MQLAEDVDSFNIDLVRLDAILIGSVFPKCYLCGEYFLIDDLCVSLRVPEQLILRLHRNKGIGGSCWKYFILGLELYDENEASLKVKQQIIS